MTEPLKTLQKAIYFPEELPSEATIGYHCTVVGNLSHDSRPGMTMPDAGYYRVFVHHLQKYMIVPRCELFGLAESDPDFLAKAPGDQRSCEIRFDHPLEADQETIRGAFRLPGRQWEFFHLWKWDFTYSSYEFACPVHHGTTVGGILSYRSPRAQPLNRLYVLTALTEVFGRRVSDNAGAIQPE